MNDVLAELGPVFLGSRLKRLAERLQASAAQIIEDAGLPLQPPQIPLLTALDRGPVTVGHLADMLGSSQPGITRQLKQLSDLGLIRDIPGDDQRHRRVVLTTRGQEAINRAKLFVWPRTRIAVDEICGANEGPLLEQILKIEQALATQGLAERAAAARPQLLKIREFDDSLARDFHDINEEWIAAMFRMEETDRQVLENPRQLIVDSGGVILFVEAANLGIVGTCALQRTKGSGYELTKMGVRASARGLKAGEFLLAAMVARAKEIGADPLYLLTNSKCEAAIHLYEKLGFRHDEGIMRDYGARYERCDVAMRYSD